MKYFLVTLGCPRNQVDSDFLVELLNQHQIDQVFSVNKANVCLVNTCAFIEAAKEESLEEIFTLLKKRKKTVVLGCLAQRYGKEIFEQIPEVSAVVSPDNYSELPGILEKVVSGERVFSFSERRKFFHQPDYSSAQNRFKLPLKPYNYLKITEGCNNRCAFCAIPEIRGDLRSFPLESLLKRVKKMLASGCKEIVLVGQDVTAYGLDWGRPSLELLLEELSCLEGDFWIRLLYLNPIRVNEKLLDLIARRSKIVPYFDLPYQHASTRILKRMGRRYRYETIVQQVKKIRERLPEAVIRTTFIVGFPGETEKDFQTLLKLIKEANFDYVGVFDYSKEEGTVAAKFSGQVSKKTKMERKERLSFFADELSFRRLSRFLGKEVKVLVEAKEGRFYRGRFFAQAPEIDGEVILSGKATAGSFSLARLERQEGFDFKARVISG